MQHTDLYKKQMAIDDDRMIKKNNLISILVKVNISR